MVVYVELVSFLQCVKPVCGMYADTWHFEKLLNVRYRRKIYSRQICYCSDVAFVIAQGATLYYIMFGFNIVSILFFLKIKQLYRIHTQMTML